LTLFIENIAIQAVILLPLLSFLLAAFRTAWLNSFLLFVSCLSATFLLYQTWFANHVYQFDLLWFTLKETPFKVGIWVDSTTSAMFFIVSFVSALVHLFSMAYMKDDKHKNRYFAILGLFTFAMQSLLLTSNLLIIYIFWELVGFCSYLLIGFWHEKSSASRAAKKAFLFNRVGDIGFLLAISLVWFSFGTLDIRLLMQMSSDGLPSYLPILIGIGFVTATCGKSAQLPLSVWLPDAMEAPTPVSALIHAATMVAAGIYLLIRVNFLLVPDIQMLVVIIGTLTALLAAFAALSQTDMKRLLAYSTVSQLGYMMTAVGLGNTQVALFHLLTHAFFKAGLFLCAGVVIHYLHEQDMRKMGGLRKQLPLTFISYSICAFSLAGLPFFSGFLSKDMILDGALVWAKENVFFRSLVPISLLFTSLLTAIYVGKQWSLVFLKTYRGETATSKLSESWLFGVPTLILAIFSIGFIFSLNPFSPEKSWLLNGQSTIVNHWLTIVSACISCFGLFIAWCMYGCEDVRKNIFLKYIFKSRLYKLSYHFFYLDFFYYQIVKKIRNWLSAKSFHFFFIDRFHEKSIIDWSIKFSIQLAYFDNRLLDRAVKISGVGLVTVGLLAAWFDKHIIDGSTHLTAWAIGQSGKKLKSIQNGKAQSYFVWAMIGFILLIALAWWQNS